MLVFCVRQNSWRGCSEVEIVRDKYEATQSMNNTINGMLYPYMHRERREGGGGGERV